MAYRALDLSGDSVSAAVDLLAFQVGSSSRCLTPGKAFTDRGPICFRSVHWHLAAGKRPTMACEQAADNSQFVTMALNESRDSAAQAAGRFLPRFVSSTP